MEPEHNSKARRIVLRLSHAHDNLPSSLFITGVRNRDLHPSFGGGFGEVYRASYAGKTVALKHMRTFHRGPESRRICWQFCREALVWQNLKHPNILPLIGIDRESFPSLCMVSPWMEHGTIMKYLNDHGRERVDKLLCEIAQGLQYLHSHNIVHGDLRGANILVTHDWSACLADFGLATLTDATMPMFPTSSRAGSVRWMAPELLSPEHFGLEFRRTAATDVYAFGSVCIELYTGRAPFAEVSEGTALLKIIDGEKPKRPTTMDDVLWYYVNNYLGRYPATRPHIDVVFQNMVIIRLQLAELCAGAAAPQIRFSVR
ncbi:kinase-like domain-containing protein [Mycena rebaudengoi]|nr:kinase-like domain-containing protein [Mycena rebaudengoi]